MRTLRFDETTLELVAINQTKLPLETEYIRISESRVLYQAIKELAIRGAPAIGVGAALGLYACALRFEDKAPEGFLYSFDKTVEYIASSRPTARNLFYACGRMSAASRQGTSIEDIKESLKNEAFSIEKEDIELCRAIGKNGEKLIRDGAAILTHCNAGALCAVEYGTALAPIYEAKAKGKAVYVYADETRPLLQGARLTCFELTEAGIDTTLICDNMAAGLMAKGKIDLVIVGCDRVAANGDFANKTGTLSLAVNARHFGVPFYVAVPSSTVDLSALTGDDIVIEERDGAEITEKFFKNPIAPESVKTYNPAFDVTPGSLVTGYITEKGVFKSI
ncbi:MAG: S-methyl-5-thioribose-1-phosphate isomerase [Eubacteriales bacterium]|nr:S-methyl-5-thioribose-1-phosphate isomerase [Eubacteriales bacterium]